MKTTRYAVSCNSDCGMDEDENGEYVKYTDIEDMCLELTKGLLGEKKEDKSYNKGNNMNGFKAIQLALEGNLEIRIGRGDGIDEDPFLTVDKYLESYGDSIPTKLLLMDEWQVRKPDTINQGEASN